MRKGKRKKDQDVRITTPPPADKPENPRRTRGREGSRARDHVHVHTLGLSCCSLSHVGRPQPLLTAATHGCKQDLLSLLSSCALFVFSLRREKLSRI